MRQVYSEARATLARSRGDNQFWVRAVEEPLDGAPERRSRGGGLPRDRTQTPAPPAPAPDAPTWEQEREHVLDALRALCDLCETLHARVSEIQKQPWQPVYQAMAKWGDAECARIEQESLQQKQEQEPLELPPLNSLRQ